jgi:hypothetical protein
VLPNLFLAVTATRKLYPPSALVTRYEDPVPPLIEAQLPELQRCHWKE